MRWATRNWRILCCGATMCAMTFWAAATLPATARQVKVGVFEAAPLVMVRDGKPTGLFIELLRYIASRNDWQIEYVVGEWGPLQGKLQAGEIDVLPALGFTVQRAKVYDFSAQPIYIDSGVIFTSPSLTLHTVYDLRGKRVATLKDSIFTQGFQEYIASFGISCELVYTADNRQVMEAITKGRADAGVCIYSLGNELAKEYPVIITPINFSPLALEYAVAKGRNQDIIAAIDAAMAPMVGKSGSEYSRLFDQWTQGPLLSRVPPGVFWAGGVVLGIGTIIFFWNLTLRARVRHQTRQLVAQMAESTRAREDLQKSLRQKDLLFNELSHRTKNTLGMVIGMVQLKAMDFSANAELQDMVRDMIDRLRAISLVHNMLYRSEDLSHVSIRTYLTDLVGLLRESRGTERAKIDVQINIDEIDLLFDVAIPVGLMINELVVNSFKHAFPDSRAGSIAITLTKLDETRGRLVYADDGIGVPEGFDFLGRASLGIKILENIAQGQLQGSIRFERLRPGLSCTIEFRTDLYAMRI